MQGEEHRRRYERCLICPCNAAGICRLLTSHTPANPNRQFYKCPALERCSIGKSGFFKWADTVRADELINVPYCGGCMAGLCRVRREKNGHNAGKILFMCCVKEGEGSCGYRVWQDELEKLSVHEVDSSVSSPPSNLGSCNGTSSPDINLAEESRPSEKGLDGKPSAFSTSQGEGSSGYRVWQDKLEKLPVHEVDPSVTPPPSNLGSCNGTSPPDTNVAEESKPNENGPDGKSPEVSTSQGEGLCGYRVWQGELEKLPVREVDPSMTPPPPSLGSWNGTSPPDVNLAEENRSEKGPDDKSPVVSTSRHLWHRGATCRKMNQFKRQEDKSEESLRSPNKRLRYGDLKAPATIVSAHSYTLHLVRKPVLMKQHWWIIVAIHQNLGPQLQGWWGRLVFHPLPGLIMPEPKTSICCVSSPLDPITPAQEKYLVNSGASTTLTKNPPQVEISVQSQFNPDCNAELSCTEPCAAIDVPSHNKPIAKTGLSNVISESVSKAFALAAEHLQNDLLTLLESTDPKDHQAMTEAAEATFTALDRLSFNHQHFDKRVNEFIQCATSLSALKQSIPRNDYYHTLASKCDNERMKLDEMNCAHANTVNTVVSTRKLLKGLEDKISSTKTWLLQMEAELLCSEVELRNMEHKLEQISKDKEVLEINYVVASKDLEESIMLRELKEAERDEAKAAFDSAKSLLRG